MPKFEKGNRAGRGRPKGSPNKRTAALRSRIEALIDSVDLESDISALTPVERVKMIASLIEFILPKMQRTDADIEARIQALETSIADKPIQQ